MVGHNVDRLSAAGFKETLFGVQPSQEFSIFIDVKQRGLRTVIRVVVVSVFFTDQGVTANLELVALAHLLLRIFIEGGARKTDDNQHNTKMNNVSTVPAHIAAGELIHSCKQVGLQLVFPDKAATDKFRAYSGDDQGAQAKRQHRVHLACISPEAHAVLDHYCAHYNFKKKSNGGGDGKVALDAAP